MTTDTTATTPQTETARGSGMQRMTEAQAIAEGLTVLRADGLPGRELPADTADRAAIRADELAAVVESMLTKGHGTRMDLESVRDGLGELHVEMDVLAEQLRQTEHDSPAGSAGGRGGSGGGPWVAA